MKYILIFFLFFSTQIFSQVENKIIEISKDSTQRNKNFSLLSNYDYPNNTNYSFIDYRIDLDYSDSFNLYNKYSGNNDYYFNRHNMNFPSPRINLSNYHRVFKIDSTNPYGASSFKEALIIGSLGKFLKFKL